MRPLWERYYSDTDAIIYVVNSAETSFDKLLHSRCEFKKMCENTVLKHQIQCGLPILIFANQLDLAYREYDLSMERAKGVGSGNLRSHENGNDRNCSRGISWNEEEEDNFVGSKRSIGNASQHLRQAGERKDITERVVDFHDLVTLFEVQTISSDVDICTADAAMTNVGHDQIVSSCCDKGNIFLFGGSAKSGEGVRAAIEYLVAHAKNYHLARYHR